MLKPAWRPTSSIITIITWDSVTWPAHPPSHPPPCTNVLLIVHVKTELKVKSPGSHHCEGGNDSTFWQNGSFQKMAVIPHETVLPLPCQWGGKVKSKVLPPQFCDVLAFLVMVVASYTWCGGKLQRPRHWLLAICTCCWSQSSGLSYRTFWGKTN